MSRLRFKPRATFTADLKRLSNLDRTIVVEIKAAIAVLLEEQTLPAEFKDHRLSRRLAGYREFHLRDTPNGKNPSDCNDVLVVYSIDTDTLILIGIRVGSHHRLFPNQNSTTKYRKKR